MADYEIIVSFSGKNAPDIGSSPYALAWLVNENQNQDSIFWYDINVDGIVDNLDTLALFERWVQTVKSPTLYFIGDINSDGTFDDKDIEILNSQMNRKADWLNNASFQLR
jgi:hypothetical protein